MTLRLRKCAATLLFTLPLLSACGTPHVEKVKVEPPTLVSNEAHVKALTDKLSSNPGDPFAAFAGLNEILANLSGHQPDLPRTAAKIGKNIKLVEQIVNEGKASEGLRFVIKGTALTSALVGAPKKAILTSYEDVPRSKNQFVPATAEPKELAKEEITAFVPAANGAWGANLPKFAYQSKIEITILLPAQQAGSGDLHLDIYPSEPNGISRANFIEHVTVIDPDKRDEEDDRDRDETE